MNLIIHCTKKLLGYGKFSVVAERKNRSTICEANAIIKEFSNTDERLRFIDCTGEFLDSNGQPILKYFKRDKIHLNEMGYAIWTLIIGAVLKNDFFPHEIFNATHQQGRDLA